ncbi:signal peptidase I [Candidatus Poribacteria bacterium]|nr:signal peptidase I [Candidatus Poribacteria bacterium]
MKKQEERKESKSKWDERISRFKGSSAYEYVQVIFVAFAVVFGFLRPFIIEAYEIPTGSMRDTLLEGDRILVCKFIYGIKIPFTDWRVFDYHKPQRGDIFVFIPPHEPNRNFVKRIVGVGGDVIETRGRHLYVNGKLIHDESYTRHEPRPLPDFGPYRVPKGYVFAMGDNRDRSNDSRFWGPVPLNNIKGKAFIIYWSQGGKLWQLNKIRWRRIGKILHSQFSVGEDLALKRDPVGI